MSTNGKKAQPKRKVAKASKGAGEAVAPRPPGRPSLYSTELVEAIAVRLEKGETLTSICRDEGFPDTATVYLWMSERPDVSSRIARAREIGFDAIAESCVDIAESAPARVATMHGDQVDGGDIQHKKLRIWTRMQLLAKWAPKKYGDKIEVDHKGKTKHVIKFKG